MKCAFVHFAIGLFALAPALTYGVPVNSADASRAIYVALPHGFAAAENEPFRAHGLSDLRLDTTIEASPVDEPVAELIEDDVEARLLEFVLIGDLSLVEDVSAARSASGNRVFRFELQATTPLLVALDLN